MGGKNNQGNQGGAGSNLGLYGGNQNQTQQNVGGMKNNGAGQQYSQQQAPQYQSRPNFQNLYNEYVSNAPQRFNPADDTGFFQDGRRPIPTRPVERQAPGYMGGNPYGNDTPMTPPRLPPRPIPTRPFPPTGGPLMPFESTDDGIALQPFSPTPMSIGYPPQQDSNRPDVFTGGSQYFDESTGQYTGGPNAPKSMPDMFTGGSPTFDESAPVGATQPWQPGTDSPNRAAWDEAITKSMYENAFKASGVTEDELYANAGIPNPNYIRPYNPNEAPNVSTGNPYMTLESTDDGIAPPYNGPTTPRPVNPRQR